MVCTKRKVVEEVDQMKGVLLAGGYGTRLGELTQVTNKHLLGIFSQPMIYYPIRTLVRAGINEILIVTGREHMGDMMRVLGSGEQFKTNFTYKIQDEAKGIAHALLLAEGFCNADNIAVILGDNLFEDDFKKDVEEFEQLTQGAKVFLKEVTDPERFGVAEVEGNRIFAIVEKPKEPISNLAVTGLYFYDPMVFDVIKRQITSARGELEITDTNESYIDQGDLYFRELKGFWSDMGTYDSLLRSSIFCSKKKRGG